MKRLGITAIECVIVLFIILILAALLYPSIQAVSNAANGVPREVKIQVIEYDGHEYLIWREGGQGMAFDVGNHRYLTDELPDQEMTNAELLGEMQ